ncbi:uncharacterized protein MYCFIDRAFT_195540 [Pseudocercospora fijiensis CIRAD86]|uniref:Zn(2)-C6 fungal-type domain-containing protein n=1 Tax=Pseudocercospora fijiensis (strain CIRAD86) TaxID=383855 RepID=M3B581_PSEFD|nr:uncharacterized protein MYCFIDRAFT_195540 [Pseudocercospora fijiensis CIRAD86]EME84517.1 hypothetical protein MYCFIDRAFT_195540 [Pseudocercospora fijiensis CIRAD86]
MEITQTQGAMAKATLAAFEFDTPLETAEHQEQMPSPIKGLAETRQAKPTIVERPCDGCRSRKKKCDKLRPRCSACLKRKITCYYSEPGRSLKRKRAVLEASVHTTVSARTSRDGSVESLPEKREPAPSTRFNSPEAELAAVTAETVHGLGEDEIAQIPYWKWMNRRKAFEEDMERASEKLREEREAGRSPKDSVIESDVHDQEVPRDVNSAGLEQAAEMGVPQPRTAAQRVFGIYELLERILLGADMKTVLLSQRVDKTFQNVINRSTSLQQKLFLKPCYSNVSSGNPLFKIRPQTPFLMPGTFEIDLIGSKFSLETIRFDSPALFSRAHENESWRRMLVVHPLSGSLCVLGRCPSGDWGEYGTVAYPSGREIKMQALWAELVMQQRTKDWSR